MALMTRVSKLAACLLLLALGLPGVAAGLAAGASTDPFSPKKVKQVKMCFSKYNITTGVPVTGATIMGYPCDAQDQALTDQAFIGLFSFITTPPICTSTVIGGKPGQYEAFVTAMVTFGKTQVAYDFTRTTFIKGVNPGVTTCVDGNNQPNGLCVCELEPEVTVVTGTSGKISQKMVGEIAYNFTVNPVTLQRSGAVLTLTYRSRGPNVGYL